MILTAYLDEAGARLPDGRRLSVLAAVLTDPGQYARLVEAVHAAQIQGRPWHYYDETPSRRVALARVVAELDLHGTLVATTSSGNTEQERARARLLEHLRPLLLHGEQMEQAVLESRGGGDKHDRRTLERMRRTKRISSALRISHEPKSAPLLQLADFMASAYVAAHHHSETQPWQIVEPCPHLQTALRPQ